MPLQQFLPFAAGSGANTLTAAQYAALGELFLGFQSGVASSQKFNTFARQVSTFVAALAQFTADNQAADVLDNGNTVALENQFRSALEGLIGLDVQAGKWVFGTDVGAANAAVVNLAPAGPLTDGMQILVAFPPANVNSTTSPTMNVNSSGAKSITKQAGIPVQAGDLSGRVPFIYNAGTSTWQIAGLAKSSAGRVIAVKIITASGTYTPSSGMTFATMEGTGGGAGGAGATVPSAGNASLGGPGTSGTYGVATFTAAQIGGGQAVSIGAPGAATSGANGGPGGTTSFGSLFVLPGGVAGGVFNNATVPTINGNSASAGSATGANIKNSPGSATATTFAVTASVGTVGPGGSNPLGTGGYGGQFNQAANQGTGYGSGGSGVMVNSSGVATAGGAGAPGVLIITEYGA